MRSYAGVPETRCYVVAEIGRFARIGVRVLKVAAEIKYLPVTVGGAVVIHSLQVKIVVACETLFVRISFVLIRINIKS